MNDQFEIPADLPPVPDGYVYAGLGKDLADHYNDETALANDWSGSHWFPTGLVGGWAANNHYAVRADSDLGREILAKRPKPSWEDAPADATHLAQHDDGEWVWFMNCDCDPIPQVSVGAWSYGHCGPDARCSHVIPKGKPNPNWHDTLERRPAQESSREVGKLHLTIDASEVEQALKKALDGLERKLPDMFDAEEDIDISSNALSPDAMMDVFHALIEQGYRVYWDHHGLRGWKGESE